VTFRANVHHAESGPPGQTSLALLFVSLATFLSTIDGLRDLVGHGAAGLAELDERGAVEQVERLRRRTIDLLPIERRPAASAATQAWMSALIELAESGPGLPDVEVFGRLEGDLVSLIGGFEGHPLVQELVLGFYGVLLDRSRRELLYRSVLITAVGAFEAHVASLISEWLRRHPKQLSSGERDLRVDELIDAGSLPAMIDVLIERRVEAIIRGGYLNWTDWLQSRLKVRFDDLAMEPTATRELFARRHLYVHSGGVVGRRYRAATGGDVEMGVELPLGEAYVFDALDRLSVLGLSLAVATRRQLAPDLPRFHIDIASRTVDHFMRRDRWAAALRASEIQMKLGETNDDRLVAKANVWLAQKHLLGAAAIRKSVQAWNVSGLPPIFRVVQCSLLNQTNEAADLARGLVATGVADESIVDWPMFADIKPQLEALFANRQAPAV
jgi:hypothetical protein